LFLEEGTKAGSFPFMPNASHPFTALLQKRVVVLDGAMVASATKPANNVSWPVR